MDESTFLFLLPSKHRDGALKGCHSDIAHLGIEGCLDLLRDRIYWPTMGKDVENYVRQCGTCFHLNKQ